MNTSRTISTLLLVVVASSGYLVSLVGGQFLPQSHLGRLVQSIASPLMIPPGGYSETAEAETPYPDPSSYYPQAGIPQAHPHAHMSAGRAGSSQMQPEPATRQEQMTGRRLQMLQQAPSQQRRFPQQYYGQPMVDTNNGQAANEEDQEDRDQGAAPSNNKQRNPEYQMGAYLGPTIDDKEINGAFNSNNDDRDEDDGPSSYDGPSKGMGRNKAANNAYNNDLGGYGSSGADESNYGQQPSSVDSGYQRPSGFHNPSASSGYDEDGADEAENASQGPRSAGGRQAGRAGLSRAASQYQQQGGYGSGHSPAAHHQRGPMMAAANGYAPFGYAGPVDLTGLVAGVNGDPSGAYQVYNGDGSYPGANYYQQQQQQGQRGNRNQAGSMSNYNTYDGYGPVQGRPNGGQRANRDNDDHDSEADDD